MHFHENRPRYAGGDSKGATAQPLSKSEVSKQNMAVAKKSRTAQEMKVIPRMLACLSNASHRAALCVQELAKSLRRSSGGGGVIKSGFELLDSSPSPPRGRVDDGDDAESVLFMEQGRQVYGASRARSSVTAAVREGEVWYCNAR